MAETVTALVTAETETITANVTSGSETFTMEINVAPRGPAGSGGTGGSVAWDDVTDKPTEFPAANTETAATANTIAKRTSDGSVYAAVFYGDELIVGDIDGSYLDISGTSIGVNQTGGGAAFVFPTLTGNHTWTVKDSSGTFAWTSDINKTAVGLGNVENTALSTWAGTTNITTIGTLSAFSMATGATVTLTGTSHAAWLTALGASETVSSGKPILWGADTAATRAHLGSGLIGDQVFTAATAAAIASLLSLPGTLMRVSADTTASSNTYLDATGASVTLDAGLYAVLTYYSTSATSSGSPVVRFLAGAANIDTSVSSLLIVNGQAALGTVNGTNSTTERILAAAGAASAQVLGLFALKLTAQTTIKMQVRTNNGLGTATISAGSAATFIKLF